MEIPSKWREGQHISKQGKFTYVQIKCTILMRDITVVQLKGACRYHPHAMNESTENPALRYPMILSSG